MRMAHGTPNFGNETLNFRSGRIVLKNSTITIGEAAGLPREIGGKRTFSTFSGSIL